ncbi:MAG: site-specific DNA-methyltransferase [Candidatus Caldarchaeum sp.]|nr:site-specific DNA-methyltransferase [Candidatus Caldarchaeum sp.]MCX8201628.1 site-specific DNA-methyltransferase [Candidatus Caldarchaeum sp.]
MTELAYIVSTEVVDSWKNVGRNWGNSLHRIMSRTGSFPPALARWVVEKFSERGDVVLDPFSGKGTAPLEACLTGRVGVGNDLAPEAYVVTRAKVNPVSLKEVRSWLEHAAKVMRPDAVSVYDAEENVRVFYHPQTLKQILAIREVLFESDDDVSNFVKACMLGILHGSSEISLSVPCSHSFSMAPDYLRRYVERHGLKRPVRNVLASLMKKAEAVLADGLPPVRGAAFNTDALRLPFADESVDLVVTSPPYFNLQTYAWDNWLRLWFLGYDYRVVGKRLFGTQSVPRYVSFMEKALREMFRVLRFGGFCVLVVGDVKLGRKRVDMAELLLEPAEDAGFVPEAVISDGIRREHKYLMYLRPWQGVDREKLLVLAKGVPRKRVRGLVRVS